jgi:NitT/TauT family transport system substrate-binding protein
MVYKLICFVAMLVASIAAGAAETPTIKIGLLRFGTVAWELDTIRHHGLDRKHGFIAAPAEFATNEAAKVALQAGAVDMIVTDWPWVARQRAEGADFAFIPYSRAVGMLLVSKASDIATLSDLKGKRIGVAGGPLDKSWLLLRAFAHKQLGMDLAKEAAPVFAAPPLLSEELARGRLDAVLTYWHYAARLEAEGARPLLTVADIIRRLGVEGDVPMLGYAFREGWASRQPTALQGFVAASREAKATLGSSREEWTRLVPLIGTSDPGTLDALQAGYRAGIPLRWTDAERKAATDLYAILRDLGGEKLVGQADTVDPGTFWPAVSY